MKPKRRVLPLLLLGGLFACTAEREHDSDVTQADALVTVAARWSLPDVVSFTPPRGTTPALAVTRQRAANIADEHAVLHAVRADGSEIWAVDLGLPEDGFPGVGADGTIYTTVAPCQSPRPPGSYVSAFDLSCAYALVALDPATGAETWRVPLGVGFAGSQRGKVLVNPANGDVYASANAQTSGMHMHAVRADGTVAWDRMFSSALLVAPNGTVYVVDGQQEKLYAFSPPGAELWSARVGTITASPVFGSGGTIVFGDWHGKLYAFSSTGEQLYARQVGTTALRGEPIILADGSMVVRHDHGADNTKDELLGLDPTGAVRWSLSEALPPVLGPNGAIYASRFPGAPPGEAICAYDAVTGAKRSCSGNARIVPLASDAKLVYGAEYASGRATSVVTLHDAP